MSLVQTLNGGKQKIKLHVSQIRENPKNAYINDEFYSQEGTQGIIEAIANSIEKHGQLHNAVVYAEKDEIDNKEYTLLSGAKRYRAITLLEEQGRGDGIIDVVVQEKPADAAQEVDIISDGNIQGNPALKDHKLLYQEILFKTQQYDELKDKGEIPTGLHKRDYIATHLGISAKTVTNIITEFEGASDKAKRSQDKAKAKPKSTAKEKMQNQYNNLAGEILDEVSAACDKVKLTDKELTFKYTGTDDLQHLLEILGIDIDVEDYIDV